MLKHLPAMKSSSAFSALTSTTDTIQRDLLGAGTTAILDSCTSTFPTERPVTSLISPLLPGHSHRLRHIAFRTIDPAPGTGSELQRVRAIQHNITYLKTWFPALTSIDIEVSEKYNPIAISHFMAMSFSTPITNVVSFNLQAEVKKEITELVKQLVNLNVKERCVRYRVLGITEGEESTCRDVAMDTTGRGYGQGEVTLMHGYDIGLSAEQIVEQITATKACYVSIGPGQAVDSATLQDHR